MKKKKLYSQSLRIKLSDNANNDDVVVFEGIASTTAKDRHDDIVTTDCLKSFISNAISMGLKYIPMKYMHKYDEIIGAFKVSEMRIENDQLKVLGELNIGTNKGKETYALLKAGHLDKLSIGFWILDGEFKDDIFYITEGKLTEISVVDIPANPEAIIELLSNKLSETKDDNDNRAILKAIKKRQQANSLSDNIIAMLDKAETIRDIETVLSAIGLSNKKAKALISKIRNANIVCTNKEIGDAVKVFVKLGQDIANG